MIAALLFAAILAQNTITLKVGTTTQTYVLAIGMTLSCLNADGSKPPAGSTITLTKGQQSMCTLTIDQPAPAGGYNVSPYSISDPRLILSPTSLGVPENQTSAAFTVTCCTP